MRTLFEITGDYKIFAESFDQYAELVEAGEMPEDALWDTLEAIDGEHEEKVDNMACIYKQAMYEAAMMKAEEASIRQRRKAKEAVAERLAKHIQGSMLAVGKEKIETVRNVISFRRSEKVMFDDEEAFVAWAQEHNPDLLTYKTPEPNKTVIKKILKGGEEINGARVEKCLNLQIK